MSDDGLHRCRVCGLWTDELPYGNDGNSWEWTICPCCGAEHGYEDITVEGARRHREQWIASGAKWFSIREKPEVWDLEDQLRHVPNEYR